MIFYIWKTVLRLLPPYFLSLSPPPPLSSDNIYSLCKRLLYDFLYLINDVIVASKGNKQIKLLVVILKRSLTKIPGFGAGSAAGFRIGSAAGFGIGSAAAFGIGSGSVSQSSKVRIRGSGSAPKCHGSATLLEGKRKILKIPSTRENKKLNKFVVSDKSHKVK